MAARAFYIYHGGRRRSCYIRAKRLVLEARTRFPLCGLMKHQQSEIALVEVGALYVRYGSSPVPSTTSARGKHHPTARLALKRSLKSRPSRLAAASCTARKASATRT